MRGKLSKEGVRIRVCSVQKYALPGNKDVIQPYE